jgi:hypothetical protein
MSASLRALLAGSIALGSVAPAAHAQSRLEDVRLSAIGPAPVRLDSTTIVRKGTAVCSARRLCKKGWDLAMVGIEVPKVGAAKGQPMVMRFSVTNLGRVRSPQVPVRVELGEASERVMTPELLPGDTVSMAVRIVPQRGDKAVVQIDPERLSGDTLYVDNNTRESEYVPVEYAPTLELAEFAILTPTVRSGAPVRLTLRVRNASKGYTVAEAVLTLSQPHPYCLSGISPRIPLPALPPQQELTATVVLTEVSTLQAHEACMPSSTGVFASEIVDVHDYSLLTLTRIEYTVRR